MNTKQWMQGTLVAGLAILGVGVGTSGAATYDNMRVSVTPNVTYAVQITSPTGGGYDFQQVDLAATSISTAAIGVKNVGTVAEYFGLAITNTSGSWTPGAAPAADVFRMTGYFNATQPASTTFDTTNDYLQNGVSAGQNKYGQSTNKTNAGVTANLWLRLDMPSTLASGGTGAQTMTLTVNGQSN